MLKTTHTISSSFHSNMSSKHRVIPLRRHHVIHVRRHHVIHVTDINQYEHKIYIYSPSMFKTKVFVPHHDCFFFMWPSNGNMLWYNISSRTIFPFIIYHYIIVVWMNILTYLRAMPFKTWRWMVHQNWLHDEVLSIWGLSSYASLVVWLIPFDLHSLSVYTHDVVYWDVLSSSTIFVKHVGAPHYYQFLLAWFV